MKNTTVKTRQSRLQLSPEKGAELLTRLSVGIMATRPHMDLTDQREIQYVVSLAGSYLDEIEGAIRVSEEAL
jgi:hypothetical protein